MNDGPSTVPVDPAEFRRLMGQFATGVCVVAAHRPDGGVSGITVNSFVSVSLEPMLVCWSVQNASSQFEFWSKADKFSISILAEGQSEIASRYAARGDTALNLQDFDTSAGGLPMVSGAIGHLECKRWALYPGGDHTMIVGEVIGMGSTPDPRPLGFFGGSFFSLGD